MNATPARLTPLVIGLGNRLRGDDAVGLSVADRLRGRVPRLVDGDAEPGALFELCASCSTLVLVDGMVAGLPPGSISRFDVSQSPLPVARDATSTHGFGLAHALELARALGRLPPRTLVFAIEIASVRHGAPLSPAVAAAVAPAAAAIERELRSIAGEADPVAAPGSPRVRTNR